ncbi:uncharacterized protein CTRU02_207383 [Colletotrichum truncatum]|uniref:Uncharacterized protein n=1 Tax=Colletotrichum truncatum TaxID=5467 RepID=A0ACC3Z0P1_COLTU
MDRPPIAGSVKRARERAQAGYPREDYAPPPATRFPIVEEGPDSPTDVSPPPSRQNVEPSPSRIPRPLPPAALQNRDGGVSMAISRPTQIPQWPLPGPIPSPSPEAEPYRPPPGRGPPPQRPPRPSRVPSILDSSRVQDHTPVFQYTPQLGRESTLSQDASSAPLTPSSRHTQSSLSSVGSIPDFPLPAALPPAALPPPGPPPPIALPRRSVTLGPPPSSRRGDSSFYSNASFVSPIPEESPRSRSHTSFASSAAMPESWGSQSPGFSPGYPDEFYEDDAYSTEDENSQMSRGTTSPYGDGGDESKLVRSASVGKMQKPAIVMNRGASGGDPMPQEALRPTPSPLQNQLPHSPFDNGTGYVEGSSSSGTVPTMAATASTPSLTANAMLGAFAAASATDPAEMRKVTPSPRPYSRLSAIRRPPKLGLDMDSVRQMESRGSMTSLPDLIKRATRLAALIDRGRRPASRFDMDGEWPDEKAFGREGEVQMSGATGTAAEKHQSGLSDMLAAFPPPATTPNPPNRGSWFRRGSTGSWPLAPGSRESTPQNITRAMAARSSPLARLDSNSDEGSVKRRRRCCGLPLWAFILIVILVLGIIAAAIIVPLEFFVFRKNRAGSTPTAEPALTQCQNQLKCENGGTNVISQNVCSCICTNGFTGQTCAVAGATGCTTTNLAGSSNINNVTLGQAIPRLLQQSQTNFTIPLDGTDILAKFNTESLSCIAQNSLVTFDGRSTRQGTPQSGQVVANADVNADGFVPVQIITLLPGQATTITFNAIQTGAVIGPSGNIVGGFTTLTGPFRVTTIYASSSTMWATIPMPPKPTTVPSVPVVTPTLPPPATSAPPTSTKSQDPILPSNPVSSAPAAPTPTFTTTEETLDFARVSVLLILQKQNLMAATTAQTVLQRFFSAADQGSRQQNGGVPLSQALNVTLGGGNSVDLVHFLITIPGGVSNSTAS